MKTLQIRLVALIAVVMTGCVMGGTSVNRMADYKNLSYDRAFSAAIRAMNEIGKVTNSDKEQGYVNGTVSTVELGVTIEKVSGGGVKLNVKASMPNGQGLIGKLDEADSFLLIYTKYAN
ncbi:MAG: hypothetical protein WCH84_09725 [Verrucomicrobiota bacterium]